MSILPQADIVQRIGGDRIEVDVMVGPGQSPATYEPTPRQMARLEDARLYFRIGVPFERALIERLRETHPDLRIVDTREGVSLLDATHHGHGHGHGGEPDPHIWLDPGRVKIQAGTICEALSRAVPGQAAAFEANRKALEIDLEALDRRIREKLDPYRGRRFYVFHPGFRYFAEAYGLEEVPIEKEGKEPSPKQLGALVRQAQQEGVRVIFVQPQFARQEAETLARSVGASVETLDPLPRNYIEGLEVAADTLADGLARQQASPSEKGSP